MALYCREEVKDSGTLQYLQHRASPVVRRACLKTTRVCGGPRTSFAPRACPLHDPLSPLPSASPVVAAPSCLNSAGLWLALRLTPGGAFIHGVYRHRHIPLGIKRERLGGLGRVGACGAYLRVWSRHCRASRRCAVKRASDYGVLGPEAVWRGASNRRLSPYAKGGGGSARRRRREESA